MFKRRDKKDIHKRMMSYVWPENGWKRYYKYILLRLKRLKGTPKSIAKGVACGVAISFTPFVGFHFVLAAVTSWIIRGNIFASALGTAAGNPWTFPFIWVSTLYLGRLALGEDVTQKVEFVKVFQNSMHALITFDFSKFFSDVWPIIFPMIIGSIPFYIVSWLLSYFILKRALLSIDMKKRR